MRIAVTGSLFRPGQEGNISWLYAAIKRYLPGAVVVRSNPLPWQEWLQHRTRGGENYQRIFGCFDLVVGFELPPALKQVCPRWVEVRRHPYRWSDPVWCVRASFPLATQAVPLPLPTAAPVKWGPGDTCFTTQVVSDVSMLHSDESRLLTPEELMPEMMDVLKEYEVVWVVPHPLDPHGPWVTSLLPLPNTKLWMGTAYEAMAASRTMHTISSSTGYEAPFFDCIPYFFRKPADGYGEPVDISDPLLWKGVLEAAMRSLT